MRREELRIWIACEGGRHGGEGERWGHVEQGLSVR